MISTRSFVEGTRRWWALGAITLSVVAVGMDVTVLSLALPTLTTALRASEPDLQWFVTSYTLALSVAMLPAGVLGDRYGRKRVMVGALVLFAIGSIACAYSPNPAFFIVARAELGLAGAALAVMAISALTVLFAEAERPRAVGIWAAANFLALPLGPILGGWMLAHLWWGWVFLINVPIAAAGLVAVVGLMPESRSERRPGLDLVGLLLSSAGLAFLMYGLIEAGSGGWFTALALGPALAGLGLLAAFGIWEVRLTGRPGGEPLIDLSLFRSRAFTWGVVLAAVNAFGLFGLIFTLPQYFQGVLGIGAQGSGLRLLPLIGGMVAGAVPADRVALRLGPRRTIAVGFAILAAGMATGATTGLASGDGFVAVWTFVAGAGSGLCLATAASAALAELPVDRSGVGSGLMQALQKLGPALGATILGSVLNSTYQAQLQLGSLPAPAAEVVRRSIFGGIAVAHRIGSPELLASVQSAFVNGMDRGLGVSAVIAGAGALLALAVFPSRAVPARGKVPAVVENGLVART